LFGVTEEVLRRADFVAVDIHDPADGREGFASSRWTFADVNGKETVVIDQDEGPEEAVLANLTREDAGELYNRLFGTSLMLETDLDVLLLDLARIEIDAAGPRFTVTLSGDGKEGGPDVLFLGVLNVGLSTYYGYAK
jgi:hypothetical protein